MDEILQIASSSIASNNPLSQRDFSPDKFSVLNESRNGYSKQSLQKHQTKKFSIDTSIKTNPKFVKKGAIRMPPLANNNNSSSLNMNLYPTANNILLPCSTQLPNLHASLNSATGTGVLNTVTSSQNNGVNSVQVGLGMATQQQHNGSSQNNNHSELSPQAYSNKYQEQLIRKIANQSSFIIGSSKGFNQSNSPTQRLYKEASKQSLGTIYSSGNTAASNQYNQQSTRQSQFRSSRLYQKFYNPNGINSNPPTHHLLNYELQQSLGTLNGGNSNHSLDKLPYTKQPAVNYHAVDKITSGENSISKNRNHNNQNNMSTAFVGNNTIASNYAYNQGINTGSGNSNASVNQSTQLLNQLQQTIQNQSSGKRMSLYQKRKMKVNQVSLGNISITDERSTDIHEDNSITNYSICNNNNNNQNHQNMNIIGSGDTHQVTPYKTLNSFNNMKSMTKQSSKQNSQLRNSHANNQSNQSTTKQSMQQSQQQQQYLFQDQFKTYQRKSKFAQRQEGGCQSLQNAGDLIITERDQYNINGSSTIIVSSSNGGMVPPDTLNTHSLLLKIEEDNNEVKSRTKNGNSQSLLKHIVTNETLSKASSKTELPELRQSIKYQVYQQASTTNSSNNNIMPSLAGAYNRLQNNQSININRVNQQLQQQPQQQRFHQSFINSQTSSRAQLTQMMGSHNINSNNIDTCNSQSKNTYFEQLQNSVKKKQSKMNSIRINQELINNQQQETSHNQNHNLQHKENQTSSPLKSKHQKSSNNHQSLQPYKKKQSSQSISLKTQTSFNQSANKIRIEINKEESVLQFLTKDHKSGVSLLYYDFNNANQRLTQQQQQTQQQQIQQQRVQQNLADLIIPEETEELPPLLQQVNSTKDDINRQESAQILARIQKNSQTQTNQQNNGSILISQNSFVQQQTNSSPRNDVEIVNQKIDKARKKISRYFVQNQSLSSLNLGGNHNFHQTTNQNYISKDQQNALKNLSVDMVRMGSPFFGNQIQNQMGSIHNSKTTTAGQVNGNSEFPLSTSPLKVINNKQSDSSLKFSPIKSYQNPSNINNMFSLQFNQQNPNFNSSALNTQRSQEFDDITNSPSTLKIQQQEQSQMQKLQQQQQQQTIISNISRNTKNSKTLDHKLLNQNRSLDIGGQGQDQINNGINNSSPQDEYTNDFSFNQDDEDEEGGVFQNDLNNATQSNMKYIDIEDQSFNIKQIEDLNFEKIDQAMSMRNAERQLTQTNFLQQPPQPIQNFTAQITPHLKVNKIEPMIQISNINMQLSTSNLHISQHSSYSQESFYEDQQQQHQQLNINPSRLLNNNNYQNQTTSSKFLLNHNNINSSINNIPNHNLQLKGVSSSSQLSSKNLSQASKKYQQNNINYLNTSQQRFSLNNHHNNNNSNNISNKQQQQQQQQLHVAQQQQQQYINSGKNSISSQSKLPFINFSNNSHTNKSMGSSSNNNNNNIVSGAIENNLLTGGGSLNFRNSGNSKKEKSRLMAVKRTSTVDYIKDDDEIFN